MNQLQMNHFRPKPRLVQADSNNESTPDEPVLT